ncbi:regulatory protein RecX [Mediterraneibacter glycyrrhizinilyticus]|nr:regulatory protein RecX [Mediterraneibacter glycyrrhizinilyticus]MBM6853153.1 regulatory protein RecX [Mediterraneibacter glycyrrhizinilyticus]
MIVTKAEACAKTKFRVWLDGEFAFVLYKSELSRYGIREGAEIPPDTVEKIEKEVILKRAKLYAMHLLEDMDRTEYGLREKLRRAMYPEKAADQAVEYVRSFGYLDDSRFAENFVRSRKNSKSRREIRALLTQKGVSTERIDEAFEACYGEDEEQEAVRALLRKKRFDPGEVDDQKMRKIYAYLARKGFGFETVRQVIQNYGEDA